MTMRYWFIPTFSGDIRLEATEEGAKLTAENPTPSEITALKKFWLVAMEKGWLEKKPRIKKKGQTVVALTCSMPEVGPALSEIVHGGAETWTALRFSDGKVEVLDDAKEAAKKAQGKAPTALVAQKAKAEVQAAATVKKPARGCPAPEPCTRRASEVLMAFSTQSQWAQWKREGRMTCIGNETGRAYHVHHRDRAARRGMGHSVSLASTGDEICVWDGTVPAEEEALAAKLAIEHREAWLRETERAMDRVVQDVVRRQFGRRQVWVD